MDARAKAGRSQNLPLCRVQFFAGGFACQQFHCLVEALLAAHVIEFRHVVQFIAGPAAVEALVCGFGRLGFHAAFVCIDVIGQLHVSPSRFMASRLLPTFEYMRDLYVKALEQK